MNKWNPIFAGITALFIKYLFQGFFNYNINVFEFFVLFYLVLINANLSKLGRIK